jgi:hypothetical protein
VGKLQSRLGWPLTFEIWSLKVCCVDVLLSKRPVRSTICFDAVKCSPSQFKDVNFDWPMIRGDRKACF